MSCVLGIDGGGTKTVCVLMDDTGQVLGRGEAGASNYQSVGIEAAFLSIQSAIAQATQSTGSVKIEAICLGLAGVDRPADIQVAHNLVQQLQSSQDLPITWELQPANVVICNDALVALVGGLGDTVGIVAIVGTGSIIYGRNIQGETKRVGGWGYILGDEGSAYNIAIQGMRSALRAYDGRSEATILQQRFIEHLNLRSIEDLIEVVYRRGWSVKDIAALAPIVDRAADEGDLIASNIINQAVNELVIATQVVINAIFREDEVLEVVTVGSVWRSLSNIQQRYRESIVRRSPLVKVIYPHNEPAYGAGLLALKSLTKFFIRQPYSNYS